LDFLKVPNSFALQAPLAIPRAFQGYAWDKPPHLEESIKLRFALLGQYCTVTVFERFKQLMDDYSKLNKHEHSVLAMMTLVAEVAYPICKSYKQHNRITRVKERIKASLQPDADLDANYDKVVVLMTDMGNCLYNHVIMSMRTEENSSILSVAQLTTTVGVLRAIALVVGPLGRVLVTEADDDKGLAAMKMTARIAFEGFSIDTKRQDILNWSVSWFKRQIELDYGKEYGRYTAEPDAVGGAGLTYSPNAIN
jgi:hypothetical protein